MRIILGFIFFICSLIIGYYIYNKIKKREKFFEDFYNFSLNLHTEIGFFQNKLKDILNKNDYGENFNSLLKEVSNNLLNTEQTINDWCSKQNYLLKNDNEVLNSFFKKLGKTDVKTQQKEINEYIEIIKNKLNNLKAENLKKGKMVLSLSVMLGLALLIIVI